MKCLPAFCVMSMFIAASSCVAQTQTPPSPGSAAAFRYVVDPSLVKDPWTYHESDGSSHTVALVKDDKGVLTSEFVEDEVVVRNEPDEVTALVEKYNARVVREIVLKGVSAEGKPLPPAPTTPRTILQIDASSSPLRLEDEAAKIRAVGSHTFSTAKSANLAAIVAHERSAGHSVLLNFLLQQTQFPVSSREQKDQNGQGDAYQWPEFDHRAWQYVLDAGIKTHPSVAIIDSGFWLNTQGVPCGYAVDSLCQTSAPAIGNSDLPEHFQQWDATGGSSGLAGGPSAYSCATNNFGCIWHGNRSASVALGKIDNRTGAAGTGGLVAVPILIRVGPPNEEVTAAIETAVSLGASIISLSLGGNCNSWCQQQNITGGDLDAPLHAYLQNVLVVASAGNNAQDAGANSFWPCYNSLCVGAMNSFPDGNNYFTKMNGIGVNYSNFGSRVVMWAPTNIHAMPDASSDGGLTFHNGTSASAPYVAGVAALMKAVNPNLSASQIFSILWATGTQIVTSAPPDNQPQLGRLIAPLEAVVLGNQGQEVQPGVVITSPKDNAKVGQQLYQGVSFAASALDILAGTPPASVAGNSVSGQPTWCAQNTCLPTPFYSSSRNLNWPFPTTALSLRLADASLATGSGGFNWPLPVLSYSAGPVTWTSSEDGPMGGAGYSESGGSSFSYVFAPTAKPGNRVITATFKNAQGFTDTRKITVDYEPQIAGPVPVIVYPPAGATLPAGTIPVRGYSYTGVNLGYLPCSQLEWQQGIATNPIASTNYAGATGECEAKVPFKAGSQTLRLTAKGPTGQVGKSQEGLTITPQSQTTTVSISDPTDNQQFLRYFGQDEFIGLHAFVLNPPASGGLKYIWSWYPIGAGAVSKTTIGTGQSLTWTTSSVCGSVAIEVVVTSPSIPADESPTATTQIDVICSSNG